MKKPARHFRQGMMSSLALAVCSDDDGDDHVELESRDEHGGRMGEGHAHEYGAQVYACQQILKRYTE